MTVTSREKALKVARLALEKKASDVEVLEMTDLVPYTDYFVLCSGESTTQVKTISEHIESSLAKRKVKPMGVEGQSHGHWVLLDYNDVVVHVFEHDTRDYYSLERLWLDAPRIPVDEGSDTLGRKDKRKVRG